ncbi:MAG: DNA repair protein RecO [Ferruginibacter sp.]
MTHKTKGIVLRTIKYGETSLVVTIFTELFGVQTYMVNGVRTSKQATQKASHFQPASILDMIVYHNEQRSMQRIKEFKWNFLYNHILNNVIKNSIALYIVELLNKCLKQPEPNEDLFIFCEDILLQLDAANKSIAANIALYFALQLPYFFGFKIDDNYNDRDNILDLREGNFIDHQPIHPYFIDGEYALLTSQLLKVMHLNELQQFKLNHEVRRKLLLSYQDYYALHIPDFGQMKTLSVLHDVLS